MKHFLTKTFFVSVIIVINIISITSLSGSQSFSFVSRDSIIKGTLDSEFTAYAVVKNNSFAPRTLGMKLHFIEYVQGDSYSLCWGICTGTIATGKDSTLAYTIVLEYGNTSGNNFAAHFFPNNYGTTKIAYTFFNVENPSDNIIDTVTFIVQDPNYIKEDSPALSLNLFPNPAADWIQIAQTDVSDINQVHIYNPLGIMVKSVQLVSNRIDISDLTQGIYFLCYSKNGIITKSSNFIIKR